MQAQPVQPKRSKQQRSKNGRKKKAADNAGTQFQAVSVPIAMGATVRSRAPRIRALAGKMVGFRVTHKELIFSLTGTDPFTANQISLNPGLPSSFPWLSALANNFESYRFRSLRFRYIPNCPSTTVGSSYLCVDYDPADAPPTSEQQVASWESTTSEPAWKGMTFKSTPSNLAKRKSYYVRNGSLAANLDVSLYDVGNLFVCSEDNVAAAKLGKIWAEYDIELLTPQLGPVGIGNALYGKVSGTTNFTVAPTLAGNFPMTASVAGAMLTITSTQQFQCLLSYDVDGTNLTAVTPGGTATRTNGSQSINAAGIQVSGTNTVNFSAPGQTLTFTITATTVTGYAMRMAQYAVAIN
jgi:hypothetical protein